MRTRPVARGGRTEPGAAPVEGAAQEGEGEAGDGELPGLDSKAGEPRQPSGRSRVKDLAASPVQRRDDEKTRIAPARSSHARSNGHDAATAERSLPSSVTTTRLACARLPVARRPNQDGRRAAGGVRERVSRPSTCDLATRPERFAGIAVRKKACRSSFCVPRVEAARAIPMSSFSGETASSGSTRGLRGCHLGSPRVTSGPEDPA